jgi:hypothetical protein
MPSELTGGAGVFYDLTVLPAGAFEIGHCNYVKRLEGQQ